MKRSARVIVPLVLMSAVSAHADLYDCFPTCAPESTHAAKVNLCDHQAVREVARMDRDLKPAKQVYDAVTNPTGFAIKQVNDRVVHIPPWVNYALNPQGAIRAKVMDAARNEVKKQVGLGNGCVEPIVAEGEPSE